MQYVRERFGAAPGVGSVWQDTLGSVPNGEIGDKYVVIKVERAFVLIRPLDDMLSDDFLEVLQRPAYREAGMEDWEIWPPPGFVQLTERQVRQVPVIVSMVIGSRENRQFEAMAAKLAQLNIAVKYHAPVETGLPADVPPEVGLVIFFSDMADRVQKAGAAGLARRYRKPFLSVRRSGLYATVSQGLSRLGVTPTMVEEVSEVDVEVDMTNVSVPPSVNFGNVPDTPRWVWNGRRWVQRRSGGGAVTVHDGAPADWVEPDFIDAEWEEIAPPPPQISTGPDRGAVAAWGALAAITVLAIGSR